MFGISIMFFGPLTGGHRQGVVDLSNEKTGAFIKADHGKVGINGLVIQPKQGFHAGEKGGIHFGDAPCFFQVGLQVVFLRIVWTCVCESCSQ